MSDKSKMAKAALQLIHPAYLLSEEVGPESLPVEPQVKEAPSALPKRSRAKRGKGEKGQKKATIARKTTPDRKPLPSIDRKMAATAVSLSQRVPLYIWLFALSLVLLFANQVRYHFSLASQKEASSRLLTEERLKLETLRNDFSSLTSVVRFLVQRQKAQSEIEQGEIKESAALQSFPAAEAPLGVSTVSAPRANLRQGPGEESKVLMNVAQGSRLLVEETKGEWLKVYAPNGSEAWIRRDLVTLDEAKPGEVP